MRDVFQIAWPFMAGIVLGAMFFGGLWWTVRRGLMSPCPALWFTTSLFLRMGITLTGFYFVAGADWRRLLLCLSGFVVARLGARGMNHASYS
jgi:F1F0 ATPase subunit 2